MDIVAAFKGPSSMECAARAFKQRFAFQVLRTLKAKRSMIFWCVCVCMRLFLAFRFVLIENRDFLIFDTSFSLFLYRDVYPRG